MTTHFLVRIFTGIIVGLHGSSASGFALVSSDVNIYVQVPESESPAEQQVCIIMCMCVSFITVLYIYIHVEIGTCVDEDSCKDVAGE